MVSPSAWAVLRRITSSNVVGCFMRRSTGLAPLRIFVHVRGGAPPELSVAQPIGHEPASVRGDSEGVDGRQPVCGRYVDDSAVVRGEAGPPTLKVRAHAISSIALLG
jgi:hypothetical protein